MAKTKAVEPVNEEPEVNEYEVLAKGFEDRCTKLEELLATMMPDMHLASVQLFNIGMPAGVRFREYYTKTRELLGPKGAAIDGDLRGFAPKRTDTSEVKE
jgi:hypothetical protein